MLRGVAGFVGVPPSELVGFCEAEPGEFGFEGSERRDWACAKRWLLMFKRRVRRSRSRAFSLGVVGWR